MPAKRTALTALLLAPLAGFAAIDAAELDLLETLQPRIFQEESRVRLSGGEVWQVKLPAGKKIIVGGKPAALDSLEIRVGNGRGLERQVTAARTGNELVIPADPMRDRWLRLVSHSADHEAHTLTIHIAGAELPGPAFAYRKTVLPRDQTGQQVSYRRDSDAGDEPAYYLEPGVPFVARIEGRKRLALRTRLRFSPETAGDMKQWQIDYRINGTSSRQLVFAARLDQAAPVIDGTHWALSSERREYLVVPEGHHEISLTSSHPVILRLHEILEHDQETVTDLLPDREDQVAAFEMPAQPLALSMGEVLDRLDLETINGETFQAIDRAILDPQIELSPDLLSRQLAAKAMSHGAGREILRTARRYEGDAARWVYLSSTSTTSLPAARRSWFSPREWSVEDPPSFVVPSAAIPGLASSLPVAQFTKLQGELTFSRSHAAGGRVRILAETNSPGLQVELLGPNNVIESHHIHSYDLARPRLGMAAAALALMKTRYDDEALATFLPATADLRAPVKVGLLELDIPEGVVSIKISSEVAAWVAVEERLSRLTDNSVELLEHQLRGQDTAPARERLTELARDPGAGSMETGLSTFDVIAFESAMWLRSRLSGFADGTAPRTPSADQTRMHYEPGNPLVDIRLAMKILDTSHALLARRDAIVLLDRALDSLGEQGLKRSLLQAALVHEPALRDKVTRLLTQQAFDQLVLAPTLFALDPGAPHLNMLVTELEATGAFERADWFRRLSGVSLPPTVDEAVSWVAAPQLVRSAAGVRRLVNRYTRRGLQTFTATPASPVTIAGERAGPLQLGIYPQQAGQTTETHVAISDSAGNEILVLTTARSPSRTMMAESGPPPGPGTVRTLPHAGPWMLSVSDSPVDVTVRQAETVHRDSPPAETLPRAVYRLDPSVLRLQADNLDHPLTAAPAAASLELPERRTDDIPTEVLDEMHQLIGASLEPGADVVATYSRALEIEQQYPQYPVLKTLRRRMDSTGTWSALELVHSSGGLAFFNEDASDEEGEFSRVVLALLGDHSGQRVLRGDMTIAFDSVADQPRQLQVTLESLRRDYLSARPARIIITDNGNPETVSLAPGDKRTISLELSAGAHTLRLSLAEPAPNTYVAVSLADNGEARPWQVRRRYQVATMREPLVLRVAGPGLLRVIRRDQYARRYIRLKPGVQEIVLAPENDDPAYYRLHLREPVDTATIDASTPAVAEPAIDPGWNAPVRRITHRVPQPYEQPATGTPGRAALTTWSVEAALAERQELDDALTGNDQQQKYMEVSLHRRNRHDDERTWDHSRMTLREPREGNAVLGLYHRRDRDFERFGLNGFVSGSAWLQRSEPVAGSSDNEYSLYAQAGLEQTRRLGPRSAHTPSIRFFARDLSLKNLDGLRFGTTDQDVFTNYKSDHQYGFEVADEWRFTPVMDTRLHAGLSARSNSNGSLDRIGLNAGVAKLWGPISARAEYRLRHFRDDGDRARSSTARRLDLDLQWRAFDYRWRHWSANLNATYDFTSSDVTWELTLQYHFSPGRALMDYRPNAVRFRNLYQLQLPYERLVP